MSDELPKTPELDKMHEVHDRSQTIGEFLDTSGYVLAEYDKYDELVPTSKSIEQILAEHFGIDLNKVEQERRTLLAYIANN